MSSRAQEDGTSLDGQRAEIERYAASAGLLVPAIRVEVESAGAEKLEQRAELRSLLEEARAGDLVIVTKQDRFSRSTLDFLRLTADLTARGVGFLSLAERFDPATPAGRFAATIMAAVAEQEHARIRERTVGRREELTELGLYAQGRPPFGYRRGDREKREHLRLFADPTEAAIVREMFRRCIAGDSLEQVGAWAREQRPDRLWPPRVVRWVLTHRIYLGELKTADGWRATHEAIVDRATWEAAAAARVTRRKGGRPASGPYSREWILRGLCVCARCGATMGTAYGSKGADGIPLGYYACVRRTGRSGAGRCDAPFVRRLAADEVAEELAAARLVELRSLLAAPSPRVVPRKVVDHDAARERVRRRRAKLVELASDGTIERADLRVGLEKLDKEAGAIEARAAQDDAAARAVPVEARRAALATVSKLLGAWSRAPGSVKREVVRELVTRIPLDVTGPAPVWLPAETFAGLHNVDR